jgi:hypothetical protein
MKKRTDSWNQKEVLSFLKSNGFKLQEFEDGYFWVFKHLTKYPQYDGEFDCFQVNYSLTRYTSLVGGYVEEETVESFVDYFVEYKKQG